MKPSDYPPPFSADEFVASPGEAEIEVGVLIVGAGPAGLACAIRLGQLLEGKPELAERLGDVPVAVLEKGKQPGSHLLSGAVVNPRSLRTLFQGRVRTGDMPFYGRVENESVYFLTPGRAMPIPTPPTMRNHGNFVASLSQLGRWLGEQAEEAGATILPETSATHLLATDARVRGVRTGDRGRGRGGEELGNFEPGSEVHARVNLGSGLEVPELLAAPSPPAIARAHASHPRVRGEQVRRGGFRQDRRARLLGLLPEPAAELRERRDEVAVVPHRRRRRDRHRAARRQEVDGLVLDSPVERHVAGPNAPLEERAQRARVDHGAREQVRARLLALLQDRHRDVAEPLGQLRLPLQQLPEADRAREPRRPRADDQHADLDLGLARRRDELVRGEGRRVVGGLHAALRALTSSVSFGTISCRSPTTPKSAYSKIGAFGSLLIATIRPELCMPTLCWIAPEIPHAM